MNPFEQENEGQRRRSVRLWIVGVISAVTLVGGGSYYMTKDQKPAPKPKPKPDVVAVVPLPPPLPPPPPKPEPPPEPQKQELIEQQPVAEETPPEDPTPDPSPEPPGTNVPGDGKDGFGLKPGGGGGGNGAGTGKPGRRAGRFDRQAIGIQNTLLAALKSNERTRRAVFSGQVKVWADTTGRVTRVVIDGTTGDSTADQALRQDLLGLQFPDVTGVPMPVHLRLGGRRPTSP